MSSKVSYTLSRGIGMIAPESIAEILGLGASVRTVDELEQAVSQGLPKRALERLSARLYEDRGIANAYKFKVVPQATWKRRNKRLSVAESEKTERLARSLPIARALDNRLVDERNKRFTVRMLQIAAPSRPLFVAIGALHLGGPKGVLALLRARGFTVKPD